MNASLKNLTRGILTALEDKKGLDLKVLDLRKVASYTDLLVLCSGTSATHVQALVGNVKAKVPERPVYINASTDHSWFTLDYIDVVVHVFREDFRAYYGLETLWTDARELDLTKV